MSQRYIGGLIYNPPGGFSGYFDGNGDWLSVADNAALELGSGDFTIEGWGYMPTIPSSGGRYALLSKWSGSSLSYIFNVYNNSGTMQLEFGYSTNGTAATAQTATASALVAGVWFHMAAVRSGTTLYLFVNGQLVSSGLTISGTLFDGGSSVNIGRHGDGVNYWNGYISNARILKGTALYSGSTYTVPSGPLQAITNTSLLTCAYPTFRDGSSNNFTITVNGNTAVSVQNPFPLTALPNPNLGNQGNGVYTMSQYQSLRSQNLWPAIDPYWEYVTLMLHGNGTNGAQNNTFLDSSTNNFTITRNGNTTQGAFSPYGDNWSNFFNGSPTSLSRAFTSTTDGMYPQGTTYTVEAWVYPTAASGYIYVTEATNTTSYGTWKLYIGGSSQFGFDYRPTTGGGYVTVASSSAVALNTWHHVAVSVSAGSARLFVNGTQVGSTTTISAISFTPVGAAIGNSVNGFDNAYFNGYISNLRITQGVANYTSNFTPPAAPLTAISGTSLLTCQSNRFRDNSTNAFALTVNGSPSVQRFSPFHPTTPYAAGTIGGSGYFDGTGDYLSVPDSTDFDLNSTFTIDCWYYQPTAGTGGFLGRGGGDGSWSQTNGHEYNFFVLGGTIYWQWNIGNPTTPAQITGTAPPSGQWNHVAIGYNGTTTRVWVNGVSIGSSTTGYTLPTTRNITRVGQLASGEAPYTGFIGQLRIVKGTDVYGVGNTTITVPTSPLTAVTNTKLLLNFTNGGIIDNAMMNDLETVGNAQISTSVSRFGGGSLAFDGTGDYLVVPSSVNTALASGDFTIEFWFYTATSQTANLFDQRSTGTQVTPVIYLNSGTIIYYVNFGARITGSSVPTGQWNHVAVCRSGTSTRMFLNGVQTGSTYTDSNNYVSAPIGLGAYPVDGSSTFNGYIDDLRITKGYARYTANFTPQRSQWQDQ